RNWLVAGLTALIIVAVLSKCGTPSKKEEAVLPPPRVTLGSVEFARESPQLSAVRTIEAQPFRQGEESFTGQLVWNEDFTNRVFSPVAGRIQAVIVQVSQ